jgi:SAM-dependent methyltransferase
MNADPWLSRWLPLIAERIGTGHLLELGCGGGIDTATLEEAGHRVVAIDLSPKSVAKAKTRSPESEIHCQDIRAPFPVADGSVNVVVASLSLHYFPWDETLDLVRRIHNVLGPSGLLLCRLNSTKDVHYGAAGHPAIDTNYYLVDGEPKRFFDCAGAEALFADGWRMRNLEEQTILRYAEPKQIWEAIVEKMP